MTGGSRGPGDSGCHFWPLLDSPLLYDGVHLGARKALGIVRVNIDTSTLYVNHFRITAVSSEDDVAAPPWRRCEDAVPTIP